MRIISFLACCLLSNAILSQTFTQTIRGTVSDQDSEFTLPGATVVLLSVDPVKGVSANQEGYFELGNVPVGRHKLKISYVGYEDVFLPNVLVGSAKEVILKISLTEAYTELKEVVVEGGAEKGKVTNEMATVSSQSFSMEEVNRYAASIDDPARVAQSFAGVSTTDDISNEIIVRGNSPRGLLWRVNGIEVPSPNHFTDVGASGGGVSMLSNNMITSADFLTSAFPAEYGNATSGVFDINLRKGNQHKAERAFQLGVLGTDLAIEGPFRGVNRGSYLINYRYSTLALLENAGILNTGDNNIFQDLSFNFFLPTQNLGNFSLFGIGGLSTSKGFAPKDTADWENSGDGFDDRFNSDMGIIGLDHKYFLNEDTYVKTVISYSDQRIGFQEDSISKNDLSSTFLYEEEMKNSAFRLSCLVNRKFGVKNTIRVGAIGSRKFFDLSSKGKDEESKEIKTFLANSGNTDVYQVYSQWKFRFHKDWTLNTGLHALFFQLNEELSVEPRIGLEWNFKEGQRLTFGAGLHSRIEDLSIYFANQELEDGAMFQPNRNLKLTKSIHYVMGYHISLAENTFLKTEFYYQSLFNVPVLNEAGSTVSAVNLNAGFVTEDFVNKGTAYNLGTEVTLERHLANSYYYLFTASIFDSKYNSLDGSTYNTRFNANYRFTLLGGKEFLMGKTQKNLLGLNFRAIWSGGNRYTPINLSASRQTGETEVFENRSFENQVSDYWRVDLTASYRVNKAKVAHIISLQVQNVTNRENVFGYYYDNNTQQVEKSFQFGLLPVLKYRIEF